jgi:hypothetical protein
MPTIMSPLGESMNVIVRSFAVLTTRTARDNEKKNYYSETRTAYRCTQYWLYEDSMNPHRLSLAGNSPKDRS